MSLGCPRNLVDSELIAGALSKKHVISYQIDSCDIAVINTCGFIEDAKKEAIDIILQAAELKKQGRIKKLIVCGCLSQRYAVSLMKEMPEIDALLGIDSFKHIEEAIDSVLRGERYVGVHRPAGVYSHHDTRRMMTDAHYAYLKIAEGCRNHCSYCAIYKIRGNFRSRAIDSILAEVKGLSARQGFSELNIIAQDTTSYGIDRYKRYALPVLLRRIAHLRCAHWIRLLYMHPRYVSDELLDTIKEEKCIARYIDLPIQHINDRILERMNRKTTRAHIEALIEKIRNSVPSVALRTSVIVGFPGETEAEFKELLDFIGKVKFERLGAFIYSQEEGTRAARFNGQVSLKIKKERFDELMRLQQTISSDINRGLIGKEMEVLIDEETEDEPHRYIGRTEYDAPEVDGQVFVESAKRLKKGAFVKVQITDTLEYDLVGIAV